MRELLDHFFPQSQMQVLSMFVARLLVASILGAAIGLERETKHKPAGLRTNMFICFGAAMYTILSDMLAVEHLGDHTRIAAQIIPGIGFIGAGSIMRSGMTVSGLTTAATMFVVASIGMAVGGGLFIPAIFATLLILLSLELLGRFEQRFNLKPALMKYEVFGPAADTIIADVNRLLEADHIAMENVEISTAEGLYRVRFGLTGSRSESRSLADKLKTLASVKKVNFVGTRGQDRE
jgi:putative Mg2+ transporter-C (MgtC) family protein